MKRDKEFERRGRDRASEKWRMKKVSVDDGDGGCCGRGATEASNGT